MRKRNLVFSKYFFETNEVKCIKRYSIESIQLA
jgi:hypothetical protein